MSKLTTITIILAGITLALIVTLVNIKTPDCQWTAPRQPEYRLCENGEIKGPR